MKIIFHERRNVLSLLLFDDGELYASVVTLLVSNEEKSSTDFQRCFESEGKLDYFYREIIN